MDGTNLTWISFDAPYVSPEALFESPHTGEREALFWDDGSGVTVGLGAAAVAAGTGKARWRQVRRRADSVFRHLHVTGDISGDTSGDITGDITGGGALTPRLFGGLGFRDGRDAEARFVLPRRLYRLERDGTARVAVALHASSPQPERVRAIDAIRWQLERLARSRHPSSGRLVAVVPPDAELWRADVRAALAEIEAGRLRKVVSARPFDVSLDEPVSSAAVLRALTRDQHGTAGGVRFAFRRGSRTFLGLTPERLVDVRGTQVRTEALAGTAPAGSGDGARLLASRKGAHEHRLVVQDIATRLRPLCTRLLHDASPRLRASSGVQHLLTPIEGELATPRHLLDVARRLHPTPAVCGLPSAAAAHWIAEHETVERGWYSGAIGHFDAAGHGELRVALRCAELTENHARVWAGAGLVAGSDPDDELREIGLKAATMLDAFSRAADSDSDTLIHLPFTRRA